MILGVVSWIVCFIVDTIPVTMPELILKDEVYEIIGAAMDVYYRLGRGFLEPVYQEALEVELARRNIPFEPQCELTIEYKGQVLRKKIRRGLYLL